MAKQQNNFGKQTANNIDFQISLAQGKRHQALLSGGLLLREGSQSRHEPDRFCGKVPTGRFPPHDWLRENLPPGEPDCFCGKVPTEEGSHNMIGFAGTMGDHIIKNNRVNGG